MIVELQVDVVAPVEELARAGLTYATLHRSVELPFAPFIGLRLFLPSNLQQNDPRKAAFEELIRNVSDPRAMFSIRNVDYHLPSKWTAATVELIATEAFEPTLERFQAYVSLLTEFYDFEQS